MALPSSYLTSYKNVGAILDSIKKAQAPDRFTVKFLQDLGYSSAADRLIIKMLKVLGLLTEAGQPTSAYHEFLDPSQSGIVLARGLREAYSDLFAINRDANRMASADVRAKMKTISQGAHKDDVLGKMANTFATFSALANFDADTASGDEAVSESSPDEVVKERVERTVGSNPEVHSKPPLRLAYDIHVHLPATRDPAVYDALFSSLTKHLG
ncbi:DUF5343 domain-containing protein [Kribbella deserti]|uniref:DUF5343 domain-containing protein n=1 Tax=Kribbella deserti TaxID=1926257 RepID=A0ABV6QE40_9ACTN